MSARKPRKMMTVEEATCAKCDNIGHRADDCPERRLKKIWPGQFVFRGTIRTLEGGTIEMEMPMGAHGPRLLVELVNLCASAGESPESPKGDAEQEHVR
jgi:hypothetical protein